jgi:tetratricopeptide (TPR) repeat protein
MNEDSIPNPKNDVPAESSDPGLAKALEVLVAHAPFRTPAQHNQASGFSAPGTGACPGAEDWFQLAAGELPSGRTQALLAHAALCTNCLARLRESQSVISAKATREEAEQLSRYSSTSQEWQRRLAAQLAATPRRSSGSGKLIQFAWIGGGLAAALVLTIFGAVLWRNLHAPEKLLAEAYTQSRSFDLRMPGAAFASVSPQQHLRGAASDNEPVPLLSARAAIERNLQRSPSDARWLQLQARAEILEEHFDGAIDTLNRLLGAGPVSSSLLLDDGMAYYLRGTATGSENDRATALDDLRRADELAPSDPVILFNEAIVMEDRGQVMNAVETWNRFLKFERDPKWLEEGRQRLSSLEEKLNRVKSHESRMEEHLATPQSMRALASDPAALSGIDEELSTSLLPRLLDAAFPLPIDRSRGSPCADNCAAARSLLTALAASLERNHQDSWLTYLLPADLSRADSQYTNAAHALGQAIDADTRGAYGDAERWATESGQMFHALKLPAGESRAEVERAYAEQRLFTLARCKQDAEAMLADHNQYTWIQAQATALSAVCDVSPGSESMNDPLSTKAFRLAQDHRYLLLELRARTQLASWAFQSGDNEDAWRMMLEAIRCFYAGDFPPFRAGTFMASLVTVEEDTPRVHLSLLLNREALGLFELGENRTVVENTRGHLVRAALRAGALDEAKQQMNLALSEPRSSAEGALPHAYEAEMELGLASFYLDRRDLAAAAQQLDAAGSNLAGEDNWLHQAQYAAERGDLELAFGHPDSAERILREAILTEERRARDTGPSAVVWARQDRDLYAALAGVLLAENRRGDEILALWERYRLRILGRPVPACANGRLECLAPDVDRVLDRDFSNRQLIGQIVLRDRILFYASNGARVDWSQRRIGEDDLASAVALLGRVASSSASSQASIDQAAKRIGDLLLDGGRILPQPSHAVLIEADPLLGNLPWACVETAQGPIGLSFALEELPSLLLDWDTRRTPSPPRRSFGNPLVVGASVAAGGGQPLPEALLEARLVAGRSSEPDVLLAAAATEQHILPHLQSAPLIHFAGHAGQFNGETRLLLAPSGVPGDQPYLDQALFRRVPPKAARLAVFSACSTGKREEGWDHGMGDIVDTLASLGVPEVVATRWQIDSASAVPMMDFFYRGLSNGLSVPQALTAARQSLIRDARYKHPYYWAAYYASGVGTTDLREVLHGSNN